MISSARSRTRMEERCISVCSLCLALAMSFAVGGASAQSYPERPVRIIVPFTPAGGADILARLLARQLSEQWGRNVVVDNRPGAGAVIGSEIVSRSTADGYTLLLTANPHSSNPALVAKLPYDTAKDFAPVTMVASAPLLLVAHPSVAARTVPELIAYAKANPGQLTYASSGNGGPQHLAGELFKHMAGVSIVHVPYKGSSPALNDVLGGQVQLSFASMMPVLPHIKAGKLHPFGLTSAKRIEANPELPTIAESGLPGFELMSWWGVFAPSGTPQPIIAKISADMVRVLRAADLRERLRRTGVQAAGTSPEEFAAFVRNEIEKVSRLARTAGIKVD